MKQTAISTMEPGDDGSGRGTTSIFHSLNPVERTAAQVGILHSILNTTHSFLFTNKSPTEGIEMDAETVREARNTAAMAFAQLRNIVDDQPRWTRDNSDAEQEAKKLLEAEVQKAECDAYLKDQLSRPCYLLRARLFQTSSGKLAALNDTQSVHGFGDTAAEAFEEFDRNFFEQRHLPAEATPEPVVEKPRARKQPKKKK